MARFKELLAAIAEAGPGDDFADQLTAAYDEDMAEPTSAAESASARIDELTTENVTLNQALTEQKARNWDLSQLIPEPDALTGEEESEGADDAPAGIDAMFGDDEENE